MIRTIVVDDEPLARAMIECYVKKTSFLEFVGSYSNATDALEVLNQGDINLAFLDIQMPDMDGLELSRMIDSKSTKVVFTTAFDKYAVEGFKVDAVDYLLKPVSYADFVKSANRVRERIGAEPVKSKKTAIFIKSEYKILQVEFSDIEYIESAKDYVIINTSDGKKLMTQMTMKSLESQLPADTFMRVHRSYIVNLDKVKEIEQGCAIFGRTPIPISDSVKEKFFSILAKKAVIC